jgi:nucleotide-binding universal stress UspA family protein
MATWAFDRFVSTLRYFGVFPVIGDFGWVQKLMGTQAKVDWMEPSLAQAPRPIALVWGACGDVGRRVVRSLLQRNYQVWALGVDRARLPADPNLHWLTLEQWAEAPIEQAAAILIFGAAAPEAWVDRAAQATRSPQRSPQMVCDFRQPSPELAQVWGAIDDVVMGGVSSSDLRLFNGYGLFAGNVSTDNSGGFASIRTRNFQEPINLSAFEGLELRIKGDGQRYKLILRAESRWDGIGYCASFDTVYNIWQTVRIPFQTLRPVFRARTLTDAPGFDARSLRAVQLMLSKFEYDGELNPKFKAGGFSLAIETITAYGQAAPSRWILCGAASEFVDYWQGSGLNGQVLTAPESIDPAQAEQLAQTCLQAVD